MPKRTLPSWLVRAQTAQRQSAKREAARQGGIFADLVAKRRQEALRPAPETPRDSVDPALKAAEA